jgi:hypothetical protein
MKRGDRVVTPKGPGVIAFVRYRSPNYDEPSSYSVCQDNEQHRPEYVGTLWTPNFVRLLEEPLSPPALFSRERP